MMKPRKRTTSPSLTIHAEMMPSGAPFWTSSQRVPMPPLTAPSARARNDTRMLLVVTSAKNTAEGSSE